MVQYYAIVSSEVSTYTCSRAVHAYGRLCRFGTDTTRALFQ